MTEQELQKAIQKLFNNSFEGNEILREIQKGNNRIEIVLTPKNGVEKISIADKQSIARALGIVITFDNGEKQEFLKPLTAHDALQYAVELIGFEKSQEVLTNIVVDKTPDEKCRTIVDKNNKTWYILTNRGADNIAAAINKLFRKTNTLASAVVIREE